MENFYAQPANVQLANAHPANSKSANLHLVKTKTIRDLWKLVYGGTNTILIGSYRLIGKYPSKF